MPSADGTAIAYQRSGSGPAIVLVHGGGLDARQWSRVTPLLERTFTVYALDRRGRGGSGPLRPGHSVVHEANDAAAAVRAIPGPVHLLGHSSGARYAMEAALLLDDLASLILYEPSLLGRIGASALAELAAREAAGDAEGVLRVWQVDVIGTPPARFESLKRSSIWPLMRENALTVGPELRALAAYRFDARRFGRLRCPVLLLLGGESGTAMRATVEEVHAAIPRSRLVLLPGQGHGAMFSAPELFVSAVRDFVAGITVT